VYRSNGAAAPTVWHEVPLAAGQKIQSVVIGEFSGDALSDVAFTTPELRFLVNQGTLAPFRATAPASIGTPATGMIAAEIDGDAHTDLALVQGAFVRLIPVLGAAAQPSALFAHDLATPGALAFGDVDGDLDGDLVVFGMPATYQLFRRGGPAAFAAEPALPGGPATELADVDGDGDLDGICCGGGSSGPVHNDGPSMFEIALNGGEGDFAVAFTVPAVGSQHVAGAADLDLDGDVDLVAGRVVLYARGPLAEPVQPALPVGAVRPNALCDVDRDGDPDLEVGVGSMLVGRGDGTFAAEAPVIPAPPVGARWLGPGFPGDFDGDGATDLLVGAESGGVFQAMHLLRNAGGGGFVDAGLAAAPGVDFNLDLERPYDPERSLAADVDGDGDQDLVTLRIEGPAPYPDEYTAGSQIWWNDGTGVFTAGPVAIEEVVRAVADLDGDGLPDVVTIDDPYWRPAVRFNQGGTSFGPRVVIYPLYVAHPTNPVVVADLDQDGDLDLAGANHDGRLFAFTNDGSGAFSLVNVLLANSIAWWEDEKRAVATDVDGDGWLDLVAWPAYRAPGGAWIVRKLPNTGIVGGWDVPHVEMFTPETFADVDGDGDEDAVGARLIRNATYEVPEDGQRRQYGAGSAGSGGMTPVLGASGPFRIGETPAIVVSGSVGGTLGLLAISTAPAEIAGFLVPSVTLWVDPLVPGFLAPLFLVGGLPGQPGAGRAVVPVHVAPNLVGTAFHLQALLLDPGSPDLVTATNGLLLRFAD
jgi:hypothetical protein